MKKRKLNYSNIIICCLVIFLVIILLITGLLARSLIKDMLGNKKGTEVQIVDNIGDYGYQLTENNTEYFKSLYYELKDVVNNNTTSETFDTDYANLVAQLFVADFYDLNSKLNKTDVGGVQFVHKDYREAFKQFASDVNGIYYYVENNIYGDREQELPSVKEVTVVETNVITYSYKEINDTNAYQVKLYIEYEKDLGYPTHANVTLIHNDDKIEVVKIN